MRRSVGGVCQDHSATSARTAVGGRNGHQARRQTYATRGQPEAHIDWVARNRDNGTQPATVSVVVLKGSPVLPRHPSVVVFRDYANRVRLVNVVSHRHRAQVTKIHAVAASLHGDPARPGQSGRTKQETAGTGIPTVSTAHTAGTEVRAASAQSDTDG
jgi:hypothetical protein